MSHRVPTLRAGRPFASMVAAMTLLGALAPTTAAGGAITFSVGIGSSCVSGNATALATVVVTLRNGLGDLVASTSDVADSGGSWYVCLLEAIEVGDSVKADDGPQDRTLTIPKINGSLDRVTDLLSGKGPVSAGIQARMYDCTKISSCSEVDNRFLTTDATGKYTFDYTGEWNVLGGDHAGLIYTTPSGDRIFKDIDAPSTRVVMGQSAFTGRAKPGALVTTTLKTAADIVKGSGQAIAPHPSGAFQSASFRKPNGTKVYVVATDKVRADSAADGGFTVPDVTLAGAVATDVISGKCRPNGPYSLHARHPNFSDSVTRTGSANSSGNLTQDVTADLDLVAGDLVILSCRMATGDIVERRLTVS